MGRNAGCSPCQLAPLSVPQAAEQTESKWKGVNAKGAGTVGKGMGASGSGVHPADALSMNDAPRYPRQSRLLMARRLATGALRYTLA